MATFVRESKFRHITQAPSKQETYYEQLKLASHQVESDGIAANSTFLAYIDAAGSGSSVAVLPLGNTGKNHVPLLAPSYQQPLIRAHSQAVQDLVFNPFNRNQILTCSQDATLKLWHVPAEGFVVDTSSPLSTLSAGSIPFRGIYAHSSAAGIVACRGSRDIALFDIVAESNISVTPRAQFSADIQSMCWSFAGDLLVVASKDKRLRMLDPRSSFATVADCAGHSGVRSSKPIWLGDSHYFLSVGHSSSQERELLLWDSRNMSSHITRNRMDSSTSVPTPFFDPDTGILLITGKGDSSFRLFEFSLDSGAQLHSIANMPTGAACRGATLLPKQACDLMGCEILRMLKLVENGIHPLSFVVPRKEKLKFQEDLYPPTVWECEPSCCAADWLSGGNIPVVRTTLQPGKQSRGILASVVGRRSVVDSSDTVVQTNALANDAETLSLNEPTEQEVGAAASEFEVLDQINEFSPRSPRAKSFGSTLKLRNMYGVESPRSSTYFNIRPNTTNADSALIACSDKYWAIPYQGSGGGPVYVSRLNTFGKVEPTCPIINGHKAPVADIAFSSFDGSLLATAGGDCCIKCWRLPEADEELTSMGDTNALVTLRTHRHSVRTVTFHPTVQNLLTSTSQDMTVRLYDVAAGSEIACLSLGLPESALTTNISYNFDGSLMCISCKDRVIRIADPRLSSIVGSTPDAPATVLGRNLQAIWCASAGSAQGGAILSVSATSTGSRQVHLWDPRNLSEPMCSRTLDNGSGQLIPMYDESSGVCFVAGKGDTIIRYFECKFLNSTDAGFVATCERGTDFQSNCREPIAGICMLSKRHCNVMDVEVAKLLKLTVDSVIPITFTVPRAEPLKKYFQDDIFGPIRGTTPKFSARDWQGLASSASLSPILESVQPLGTTSLSAKPPEVITKPSSVRLREEIKKEEDEKKLRNDAFAKVVARQSGPRSFKVDAKLVDEDSDENNWDD